MAQLNVEIDDGLLKKVKYACIEDGTNLKKWVSAALELALDFDELAVARCKELGWKPGAWALKELNEEPIEILEEPGPESPSKLERVKKT
jgi:hypothetical protein